ncbi:MAG: hypothetical protein JNL28_09730 [Planctomycetes bacterium]|nr:hypothetical protein [Planctomycetota bacterium]
MIHPSTWFTTLLALGSLLLPATRVAAVQTATVQPATTLQATRSHRDSLIHELVASDDLARGDADAWLTRVVDLLLQPHDSAEALDEAALLILSVRAGEMREPRAFLSALERLAAANSLKARARQRLYSMLRDHRLAHMDHSALERAQRTDQFPDFVSAIRILAPLPGPEPVQNGVNLFVDPGFDGSHIGLRGVPIEWRTASRGNLRGDLAPSDWVYPLEGWALLAFEFDSKTERPAAVEILSRGSWAQNVMPYLMSAERPWRSVASDPSWIYAVNGDAPVRVDPVIEEIDPAILVNTVLRAGRNRVLIWCRPDTYPVFGVRVLVPDVDDGSACAGRTLELEPLTSADLARDSHRLGTGPIGRPPQIESLQKRLERELSTPMSAQSMALLGVCLAYDSRPIAGLEYLRRAAAAADGDFALDSLYARYLNDAPYLPEVWRRSAARTLFKALSARGESLDVEMHIARTEALEDHEEEALARLERARELFPVSPEPLLQLARVFPGLEMHFQAQSALDAALTLAPHAGSVLEAVIEDATSDGLHQRAVALRMQRIEARGADAEDLATLSQERASAGDSSGALDALREARMRAGGRRYTQNLADFCWARERFDEADAEYARLSEMYPRGIGALLSRGDIALRRGDPQRALAFVEQALSLDPSSSGARQRALALGLPDRTEELFARWRADRSAVLANYPRDRWKDSVVRVLDSQVVRVFKDGSTVQLTHEIVQVKDLEGCKREGTQQIHGDVEKLVTIKGDDGSELEPVDVEGEYVMPGLKPGDFIERAYRNTTSAGEEGLRVLHSWTFESLAEPFYLSRFVVILPRGHAYDLVQHEFDGTHEVLLDGDEEIHVFETRDRDRLQHEPGIPPLRRIAPWVQFGRHSDVIAEAQWRLFEQARLGTRVTPEIRAFAERTTTGVSGEEARAIALYDAVRRTVTKPNTNSALAATATLLSEAGNSAFLYASLLQAAGIDHELCWSRDIAPESDPDRDDPFPSVDRWARRLLVLVKPKDGAWAWCDTQLRALPYGKILGNASRAEVLTKRGLVHLPEVTPENGPGLNLTFDLTVSSDGSAQAGLRPDTTGNLGYANKDRFRELPESKRKTDAARMFGAFLPGFELVEFESPGIDTDEPLAFVGRGRVRKFLDQTDAGWTTRLPMPPSNLTPALAGGEGRRQFPYFFAVPFSMNSKVHITLPAGMSLVEAPPRTSESFHGCTYELTLDTEDDGRLTLTRKLSLAPFIIPAEEYDAFAQFCARIDAAERVPLRFAQ